MDTATKAFTDVGLPKYMAYTGNSGSLHLPGQQYHVSGSNFYSAGLVGQSVPFLSTPYQAFTHTGRPNTTVNQPSERRAGLGMYSQVRPWNEPQNVNELGNTSYQNLPINRALMASMARNENPTGNMQTLPKTNFTRSSFPTATPLQNFVGRNTELHQQAARLLQ